jgi:predicted ATPase/DNA-binding winged helix-turn-helix (wHTH) protein
MSEGEGKKLRSYRFEDYWLDAFTRTLWRSGTRIPMRQAPFSMFAHLLGNTGRPISAIELAEAASGRKMVKATAVSTHISTIRAATRHELIVTINTQGHQFTAEVERVYEQPGEAETAGPPDTLPPRALPGASRKSELTLAVDDTARYRHMTIVGPAGIGKTWFAIEIGHKRKAKLAGRVYFVDLAAATDGATITSTIARALGVPLRGIEDPTVTIAAWFGTAESLLILDSCDYVADPVAEFLMKFLELTSNVTVVATSQVMLSIGDQRVFRLDPLIPREAIALFVERASAADREFQRDDSNAALIAEICQRLDGLPLALEMAAALVPLLRLEGVRGGLRSQRFELLDNGERRAEPRHRTLRGMMEWSFGLLESEDRQFFRRLSRFAGTFSLDAAIAVAGAEGETRAAVTRRLRRLAERSLVIVERGKQPRYRLLETPRFYGAERLEEAGEAESIAERHARYYLDFLEPADEAWETMPDAEWLDGYGRDFDNIRLAADWALAQPERVPLAIALVGAAGRLWFMHELVPEGRRYCDRLVPLIGPETPPAHTARLLKRNAMLYRSADRLRAVALFERAAEIYREMGDRLNLGSVLGLIGGDCVYLGRFDEARARLGQAREMLAGSIRIKSLQNVMNDFGMLASITNDTAEAAQCLGAALDLARKMNDRLRQNLALTNIGELEFRRDVSGRAIEYAQEAASGLRVLGETARLGWTLVNLASYLIIAGDHAEARTHAAEALSLLQ